MLHCFVQEHTISLSTSYDFWTAPLSCTFNRVAQALAATGALAMSSAAGLSRAADQRSPGGATGGVDRLTLRPRTSPTTYVPHATNADVVLDGVLLFARARVLLHSLALPHIKVACEPTCPPPFPCCCRQPATLHC